jgi:hypothetical protein
MVTQRNYTQTCICRTHKFETRTRETKASWNTRELEKRHYIDIPVCNDDLAGSYSLWKIESKQCELPTPICFGADRLSKSLLLEAHTL